MSDRQEYARVNESTVDQEFTVGYPDCNPAANEILVNVNTLEGCFNENIVWKTGTIFAAVKDRIQNALLTAIDSVFAPKNELPFVSIHASC